MRHAIVCLWIVVLFAGACVGAAAQQVYRCQLADGSTTFSDMPCRSDIDKEDRVDATPHQGHRPSPDPGAPVYRPTGHSEDTPGVSSSDSGRSGETRSLSRSDRLSLERKRKKLLSGLKRRHLDANKRRALIRALRRVDDKLGIEPEDVTEMPFHNREVYEDHRIFRE